VDRCTTEIEKKGGLRVWKMQKRQKKNSAGREWYRRKHEGRVLRGRERTFTRGQRTGRQAGNENTGRNTGPGIQKSRTTKTPTKGTHWAGTDEAGLLESKPGPESEKLQKSCTQDIKITAAVEKTDASKKVVNQKRGKRSRDYTG